MGVFDFLGFGKREKPNLAQNYMLQPASYQAPNNVKLSELAKKRINAGITGEPTAGVGFGEDFVSKAGNPQAKRMRDDFNNYTAPKLSSEASARGLSRSTLALDIQRRAGQENESGIDMLMADLYKLNKMQEKKDVSEGIQLGKDLDSEYLGQENLRTNTQNENENIITGRTVQGADANNARADQRQKATISAALNTLVPGSGSFFNSSNPVSSNPGAVNPVKTNLLGTSDDELEQLYQALSRGR